MKLLVLLLAAISSAIPTQVFASTKYEYYWSMPFRESPFQQIKGINPMSAEKAQGTNHYKLTYENDKLVEYSFQLGGSLKSPEQHWYTEPGFIVAPKTKVIWGENKEIRQYFDAANKRVAIDGVWEEVISYDNQGRRIAMKYFDDEGNPAENINGVHHYQWQSHNKLSVVETRFNKAGNPTPTRPRFEYLTVRLNFNDRGWLQKIEHLDATNLQLTADSAGAAQNTFKYDKQGNFIEWRVMDVNGKTVVGTTGIAFENQFYNDMGQLTHAKFYNVNGEQIPLPWGPYSRKQIYDEFGNSVQDLFLDKAGLLMTSNLDIAKIETSWSQDGVRLLEVNYLDLDGKLTNVKGRDYARKVYLYSDDGSLNQELLLDTSHVQK